MNTEKSICIIGEKSKIKYKYINYFTTLFFLRLFNINIKMGQEGSLRLTDVDTLMLTIHN